MVVGLVLAEVGFAVYLLSPKSDPATRDPAAVSDGSAASASDQVQSGTLPVTADHAIGTPPPGASADIATRAPAPSPAQSVQGHITSAPAPERSSEHAAQSPQQPARPHPQTVQTPAVATVLAGTDSKTATVVQPGRSRDGLHRRDPTSRSTPATDELVKESAKLDPALPPPEPFAHDDQPRRGSNAVAAAMTEQLVRESAKLDPALPPPNPSGVH